MVCSDILVTVINRVDVTLLAMPFAICQAKKYSAEDK